MALIVSTNHLPKMDDNKTDKMNKLIIILKDKTNKELIKIETNTGSSSPKTKSIDQWMASLIRNFEKRTQERGNRD
jgi:hypothetical protein